MIMNLWVPQKAGHFLPSWVTFIFSRRALLVLGWFGLVWSVGWLVWSVGQSVSRWLSEPFIVVNCHCALTEHQARKVFGGVEAQLHAFFDLGTRWRWVVSFTRRPLYPHWTSHATNWLEGWVACHMAFASGGPRVVYRCIRGMVCGGM